MSEAFHERPQELTVELSEKPLGDMTTDEQIAWYLKYMKTVDDENVMMLSGMPIEIHDDPEAFADFVTGKQREMKERKSV